MRAAVELKPDSVEAKEMLRELLGDENCRRRDIGLQVREFGMFPPVVCTPPR